MIILTKHYEGDVSDRNYLLIWHGLVWCPIRWRLWISLVSRDICKCSHHQNENVAFKKKNQIFPFMKMKGRLFVQVSSADQEDNVFSGSNNFVDMRAWSDSFILSTMFLFLGEGLVFNRKTWFDLGDLINFLFILTSCCCITVF